MKKIISLLLAAVLFVSAFAFASCEKQTAYTLVSGALAKSSGLDSMEADYSINIKMTAMGETYEIPMTYKVKASGLKTDSPVASTTMTMDMLGVSMSMDIYMDQEYCYMSMLGQNVKIKIGEATEDYELMDEITGLTQPLPEELLKDVIIVKNEDGTQTVSLEISEEEFESIYKDFYMSMVSEIVAEVEYKDISLSNIKVNITVNKDGYIGTYGMNFNLNIQMIIDGQTFDVSASAEATVDYINPGTAVTIQFPEGYQDFTEIDPDTEM